MTKYLKWSSGIILSICSLVSFAESTENVVNHLIINQQSHPLRFTLNAPAKSYSGVIYPKEARRVVIEDTNLFGTYLLQYRLCVDDWGLICDAHKEPKLMTIKKSEQVIWEISDQGVKVTETGL